MRRAGRFLRVVLLQRHHRLVAVFLGHEHHQRRGAAALGALQQHMEHGGVRRTEGRRLGRCREPFGPALQQLHAQDERERQLADDVGRDVGGGWRRRFQRSEFAGGRILSVNPHSIKIPPGV